MIESPYSLVIAQRYNRTHHTAGRLQQGRYKAIVVEKDTYLLEVNRYMVLNPVRADLPAAAQFWRQAGVAIWHNCNLTKMD